jgi:molybdopterin-containing oxidoreductase family iron-sulfur binding subunit
MKKVAVSVHLGLEVDETAVAAKWHLPEAHYLEAWGDAVSADGTASVQQPLIAPLYGGRSALELTAQMAGDKAPKGYEIVRAAWLKQFTGDKEAAWRKALHDGVIASAAKPAEVKPAVDVKRVQLPAAAPKVSGVEVMFVPDASIYDGRFANNAWLQEAPDPMTKLVWDNAAMMSVATAKQLGVVDGDLIKLTSGGKTIEIAAMTQPGQADNSISIALGYGRTEVGRVGKGAGFNAYPLRSTAKLGFGEVTVAKGSGTYKLITTQEHHSMVEPLTGHKRPIVIEGTLEFWRHDPHFAPETVEAPDESIYGVHDYSKGYQWGMSIDLATCIGCNACVVACVAENNIPVVGKVQVGNGREMHWIRMDRYYTGSEDDPQAVMQPLNCQQCEAAPCESVCPVAATVHSPEGLNDMAYNRCVGTRYCANNCPYKVRRFNFLNYHKTMTEVEKLASNPDVTVRMRGVMEKCTYCVQRIQEKRIQAKLEGRRPIRDGEIVTACQQACPAEAIVFGNVNDPESKVSLLKKQSRNYALLPELNTRPRTTFLAKLRNPNPELSGETAGAPKEHHG